jgi:uncharacterized membrane protein YciS (DUF1049 family)
MKFVKTVLVRAIALVLFFLALVAGSQNSDLVALQFLDWRSGEMALSYWLLIAFLLGVAVTAVYNLWANTRLRLAARRANKNVNRAERDIDKLKAEVSAQPNTADDAPEAATSGEESKLPATQP